VTDYLSRTPLFFNMLRTVIEIPGRQGGSAPGPVGRQSFSERANIRALRINTTYHDLSPIPAKGPLGPRIDNLPRRRKASDKTVRKASDSTVKIARVASSSSSTPSPCVDDRKIADDSIKPSSTVIMQEGHCLQELVPNLFVAFADDHDDGGDRGISLREVRGEALTHIVNISSEPSKKTGAHTPIEQTVDANGTQRLHLIVPTDADTDNDNGQTILTPPQLLASRDFLSQAMPRAYHLPPVPGEYYPAVCILIVTAAPCRLVDAMSVAACYLAHESGNDVHTVLECINGEEEIEATWRGIISRDGIDLVENVARQ
jgi:hypothetical protein